MNINLKRLFGIFKKTDKTSPDISAEKFDMESYRRFMVERTIIENVLKWIDVAASKNLMSSKEVKTLRIKYESRLKELNKHIERCVAASGLHRLKKFKDRMKKEYEVKMNYLEDQIKVMSKSFMSTEGEIEPVSRNVRGDRNSGQDALKNLNGELLSVIERLEKIDRVSYVEPG